MLLTHYKKRWNDARHANDYDIIFIFREALMTRSIFFEKQFAKSRAKMVFDFDDAIWKNDTSNANKLFAWMKNPEKIAKTIALCDLVFAGNNYLADYAKQYNQKVVIVPTTIDTDEYVRVSCPPKDYITIGWSGSITTIKHFELALPFLREIKKKYGHKVRIKVIGDERYKNDELDIQGIAWTKESEVRELSDIDIGIMPLPNDEWARGKCGLKGLQYMALEIPTLMSPVGVNTEIIHHGENGYLPTTNEDWVLCISALIDQPELRHKLGSAARQTVVDKYSIQANKELYLRYFNSLC